MLTSPFLHSEIYVPLHMDSAQPITLELDKLKDEITRHNLTDIWDMILLIDYQVANVHELSLDAQAEFCGVVSLLLKAFTK